MKTKDIIKGLQILAMYDDLDAYSVDAQHDIILCDPKRASEITEEDAETLKDRGWFISGEYDCWAAFT